MKNKRFIRSMLLCTALIYVIGCGERPSKTNPEPEPDPEPSDSIKTTKNGQRDTVPAAPVSATLLFDASGSMRGYLNSSGDSRFIGVISYFENISSNTDIRLYGKKESNTIEKTEFDRMLNNGKVEWSNESDLKEMVSSMISHIERGKDVCFLLTDGILSGSDADIKNSPDRSYNIRMRQKMSEDLSAMLGKKADNFSALIVRYKAKFNGTYSSYNNDRKRLINKDRPFFVIALGRWKHIKYIEQKLSQMKLAYGTTTPYEDIIMIGDTCSFHKIKLSAAEGLNPKEGKLVIKKEFRNENITLSADLGALPAYMQTKDYMNTNIEMYVRHGRKAGKILDKEHYEISVDHANGKKTLRLSIKSSQLKDTKLTFKLKYALPEWIETKSDDNDSDISSNPVKQDKTFNLKYFVTGFTALHNGMYIKEQSLDFK